MARIIHCTVEYWDLLRNERLRPATNPAGTVAFTSFMQRRLFNTSRTPGEHMDRVVSHFRTLPASAPAHIVAIGKGRFFVIDVLDARTGRIKEAQDFLPILEQIDARLSRATPHPHPVAVLTSGDRTAWAQNRQRLIELSAHNVRLLELVESAIFVMSLDEHEPDDYADACQRQLNGDLQSRWADKSCQFIVYKNGKFGCSGDHACYDGSVSVLLMVFTMLSMTEMPEPDWLVVRPSRADVPLELEFELDAGLREEIERTWRMVDAEVSNLCRFV